MLTVTPVFEFDKVDYNKESKIHFDMILSTPKETEIKRVPLNIVLAIDCSGSMDSENKLDSVKNTCSKLVKHLTEIDSLSAIAFSNNVWVVFKPLAMTQENKKYASQLISNLRTQSSTNISNAIDVALEQAIINKSKICRIILLTDGLPTSGECKPDRLIEQVSKINSSISLSTFGYGTDFNAELMSSISSVGRGSNFYIQNNDDCDKAFAFELGGLLSLYAQNIKITITPTNCSSLSLLSDYKHVQKIGFKLITPTTIEILVDDIFYDEQKHLLFSLSLPQHSSPALQEFCTYSISYSLVDKNEEQISSSFSIQYGEPDSIAKEPNQEIKKQLAFIEAARIQKEAHNNAESGNLDVAKQILENGMIKIRDLAGPQEDIENMFTHLKTLYENSQSYSSGGSQMSNAMANTIRTGRVSSNKSFGAFYSRSQDVLYRSFISDDEDKK